MGKKGFMFQQIILLRYRIETKIRQKEKKKKEKERLKLMRSIIIQKMKCNHSYLWLKSFEKENCNWEEYQARFYSLAAGNQINLLFLVRNRIYLEV